MAHASGTFEVRGTSEGPPESADGFSFSRWRFDKDFKGGLVGTSVVSMQAAGSEDGLARTYVALERVSGRLDGRAGTFVLTHVASATPGAQHLKISVAEGLSTGDLAGLSGVIEISVAGDDHFYEFEYSLGAGG